MNILELVLLTILLDIDCVFKIHDMTFKYLVRGNTIQIGWFYFSRKPSKMRLT